MCQWATAQIKDTIFGKPKFVREKVVFLTEIENWKFMKHDGDYGHDIIFFSPKDARDRFSYFWFKLGASAFLSNEVHYHKNGKIDREIWYRKNGDLEADYQYSYDEGNRLVKIIEKNRYSTYITDYHYRNNQTQYDFWQKTTINNDTKKETKWRRRYHQNETLQIMEYDDKKREEKLFILRKDDDNKDTFYKMLSEIRFYDEKDKLVEVKVFDRDQNLIEHKKYHQDKLKEEYRGDFSIIYEYTDRGFLAKKSEYNKEKLREQKFYTYKGDYIDTFKYSYSIDEENNGCEEINFKYKFDKHKNWTEITKNVNGKDLYVWKREIEYY